MTGYILSINPNEFGMGSHDPSAAIFVDGEVKFAAEEERFNRIKHSINYFPRESTQACLDYCDITLSDVDSVVVPWDVSLGANYIDRAALRDLTNYRTNIVNRVGLMGRDVFLSIRPSTVIEPIREKLRDLGDPPPIQCVPHHLTHAASAYHPSGFESSIVVTIDGKGEFDSTVVWTARQDDLERLRTYKSYNSLGTFYGAITEFLGYRANNGEGKIMGLAPYGEYNEKIESALRSVATFGKDYDVTNITGGSVGNAADRLESVFGRERHRSDEGFTKWEKDLAHTAQSLLEETVLEIVEHYCEECGESNVCLAGGVALNCKMNKEIMESDVVNNVFIQPVAHDGGTVLGAGYLQYQAEEIDKMETAYLGPEYTTEEIKSELEKSKIAYECPGNVEKRIAEEIADGKLIGWYAGRSEMGPRALGNRSILADPRSEESRDRVNKYVKHRETWRPFAPSMLEEAAEDYLKNSEPSPFMIKTFDTKVETRNEITAVVHEGDQTTRPQTVREDQNPRYYRLIQEFENITGVPVILNTSFNDHGEPIVNTPQEALKDFFGMGLDTLVLGDCVVRKNES